MKVDDVMTPAVATVRSDASFREIAQLLLARDISGVPVLDEDGSLVGIVTEGDLIAKEAFPHRPKRRHLPRLIEALLAGEDPWFTKAEGLTAADVMTRKVRTIGLRETVHDAARVMLEWGVKRLPVMDGGRLVGIVSRHDILRVFARREGELVRAAERLLGRCAFVPPDYEITLTVSDGVVGLDGRVLYESDVRIIEDLITQLDGVVTVHNRLRYRHPDAKRRSVRAAMP